jgi:hypothetical protein
MKDAFERRRMMRHHFLGRIATDPSDPEGFRNYQNLIQQRYRLRFFVDGVECPEIIMADPEAGLVRTIVSSGSSLSFAELRGNVSIRLERNDSP